MTKFLRWWRSAAFWLRRAPIKYHYWLAGAWVLVSFFVPVFSGCAENWFRLSGMCLQLLGVLTVVWGLMKTRADFGQPTVRSQFWSWLQTFPRWNPPPTVLHPEGIASGEAFAVHLTTTSGPSADQTVEGRLGHLESIVKNLEETLNKKCIKITELEKNFRQALGTQEHLLGKQIHGISKKVETTATGGVHISALGVILLFFGTIFAGAAPELSCLCQTP